MLHNIFLDWDLALFEWINSDLSNALFDYYLPILRDKFIWFPVYIFIIFYILFNFKKKEAWKIILVTFIVVGLADMVSSHAIKKNIKRTRPCNTEEIVVVERVDCGSGYSFTSSHAANHFGLSIFLILVIARKRRVITLLLLIWAMLVSFSQVYVGVHYPIDVVFGGVLGSIIGFVGYKFYNYLKIQTFN